jgi:hypothetical protein
VKQNLPFCSIKIFPANTKNMNIKHRQVFTLDRAGNVGPSTKAPLFPELMSFEFYCDWCSGKAGRLK